MSGPHISYIDLKTVVIFRYNSPFFIFSWEFTVCVYIYVYFFLLEVMLKIFPSSGSGMGGLDPAALLKTSYLIFLNFGIIYFKMVSLDLTIIKLLQNHSAFSCFI